MRYVSDARYAELPEPLQRAATWEAREKMRVLASAGGAAARWPEPSRLDFVDDVEGFVAAEFLPQEPLLQLHAADDDATPIELRSDGKDFSLRVRRFDLVVQRKVPQPTGPDPVEAAIAQVRRILAVPLIDAETGAPLRREGSKAFADGAWIQIRCPKAGGFLGGRCPRLWVYAEARTVICSFPVLVDRRPKPEFGGR